MHVFHTTDGAAAILTDGFHDELGSYLPDQIYYGVWFADRPLDAHAGAHGDTVLVLDIPEDVLTPYEWINGWGEPDLRSPAAVLATHAYREFLVPAEIVNRYGPPQIYDR